MSVSWNYYNKFKDLNEKYLPDVGDGDTMATQAVTAINKLVYKWYNDGDVFDNNYFLEGWANDISGSANWLYKYLGSTVKTILNTIKDCYTDSDYENLLRELADYIFDEEYLENLDKNPKKGNAYSETGPFSFEEHSEYDEDY